jgi:hypothetical protein
MMRLASQPQIPPTISQIMIPMSQFPPVLVTARTTSDLSGITDARCPTVVPDSEGSGKKIG